MKHHKLVFKDAIVWRYPEAALDLATALGQIAADLWVAGKLSLTEGAFVATFGLSDEAHHIQQDRGGAAEAVGGRPEAVA
jgi:hypothetical protein